MSTSKKNVSKQDQKELALWAADCAEHVLTFFEKEFPRDDRPRKAIAACRAWARTGVFHMADVRKASLDAHAAAREAEEDSAARFAARSAGQAMATAHVAAHSIAAGLYAIKVAKAVGIENESAWQKQRLTRRLHSFAFQDIVKKRKKR